MGETEMTVIATFTSDMFDPSLVKNRYVRYSKWIHEGNTYDEWSWCEVGENRAYDVRQGHCDESDLPVDVAKAAKESAGKFPSYVDWPL